MRFRDIENARLLELVRKMEAEMRSLRNAHNAFMAKLYMAETVEDIGKLINNIECEAGILALEDDDPAIANQQKKIDRLNRQKKLAQIRKQQAKIRQQQQKLADIKRSQ